VTLAQTVDSSIGSGNTISVGDGTAYIFGGFGNNTITAADGTNYVFGASGSISFANGKVSQMMSVDPSDGGDETITVGNGANYVIGGFGSNTITAGNGGNVLIGHSGAVLFNADGSRNSIYSIADNLGGNSTLTSGTGNDILIGGAGSNILYGGGSTGAGFDIMIGNGGMVTYGPGDRLTVQSLDIRMGGSNQLFAGPGTAIMIGGLGPNQFHGSFNSDLMVGQFAYLEFIGDKLVTASCWWFADDAIAKALSSLYSPDTGLNGQSQLQARAAESVPTAALQGGAFAHADADAALAENQRFNAAVAVESPHGSDELPRLQQAQSSHPGSYDVQAQAPAKNAAPEEDRPVKPTDEHHDSAPAKPDKGMTKNATPANAEASREGRTIRITDSNWPRQNQAAPRGLEEGAKHSDISLALAGLVGWGALTSGAAKGSSGLLSRDGFKRLRNKGDNDRFLSFIDPGSGESGSAGAWIHGRSNENPADTNPQP
jgi:hypothetical protein